MEKIRLVLESSFLGTKKPEEVEAALAEAAGVNPNMPKPTTTRDTFAAILLN
jgi:hypothetical protein